MWIESLPTADYAKMRVYFEEMTKRILVEHLPYFQKHYSDCVQPHILHEESEKSSEKSMVWNLCVIEEDPGSTAGSIAVAKHLSQYVPVYPSGKPYPLLVNGDGGTVERLVQGKKMMAAEHTPLNRLEGLDFVPGEFHKRE